MMMMIMTMIACPEAVVITANELAYDDGALCTNFCHVGRVHLTSPGSLDSCALKLFIRTCKKSNVSRSFPVPRRSLQGRAEHTAEGPHAQREQVPNSSSVSEFLLLAFADMRELQLLHFGLFLGIYLAALLGNGLILTAIACDHRLHTPMYFFLLNLALLDLGCISTTLPKAMANALWDTRAISYEGCASQVFFFVFFIGAEYSFLTIMAYDRYVAICKPLHYRSLLDSRACAKMAAAAWGSGFLDAVLHTAITFSLPLCQGNAVDQFFCEIPQILKLSCSDAYPREVGALVFSVSLAFGYFVFIVLSYVQIFRAVLRMPSEQGQHKDFSTCLPHLAVVSLFVSTVTVAYLKPPSLSFPSLDLVVSVLYSVVPPAVNPLIYSMRNQELKDILKKMIQSVVFWLK
ncbi:olfactory receptor 14C36-like [Cygnus olor]|uniref:olfactory receptor 14C36-like n=1 Tax=Cygnus olor TaxID=8869 RepID=UPI001ADE970A|nr:olfactory receptor 14C36-like [Cygnus olor]